MVSRGSVDRAGGVYGGVGVSRDQRTIIEQSYRQGLNREQTLGRLRATERGVRTLAVTEIRRELRQRDARRPALANLDTRFRPGVPEITPTKRQLKREYSYSGTIFGKSQVTGEDLRINVNFGDNRRLTRFQIEERFLGIMDKGGQQARSEETGSERVSVESITTNFVEQRI